MINENDLQSAMEEKEQSSEIFNEKPNSLGTVVPPQIREQQSIIAQGDEAIKNSGYVPTQSIKLTTPLGYKNLGMSDLPSKGRFYPKDTILQIRSATIREIEHYSTMNDNDPLDVDKHLNDILNRCATLKSDTDRQLNIMDLIEGDRIFIILCIKDITFTESENVIPLEIVCAKGHTNSRILSNNILDTTPQDDESIEKYYNENERCYIVKTKNFGEIKMRPPRLGLVEYIYERGRNSEMRNQYWDKSYFSVLPFIFDKSSGPIKDIDIDNLYSEYTKWDKTKFAVIYRQAEKIKVGINPYIEIKCGECGELARSPFRIPGGTKSLFLVSNIDDELL